MPIPINPALVAGAVAYSQSSYQSIPLNICKTPPTLEGARCIPLQLVFASTVTGGRAFLVDLGAGSPPPLSQVCSMYVDATDSDQDVTILFPDTGYQVVIQSGDTLLFPVFTGTALPRFYVTILDRIIVNTNINIFAINQFIPEFSSITYQKTLNYSAIPFTNDRVLEPVLSSSISSSINLIVAGSSVALNNQQICGIQLYLDGLSSTASEFRVVSITSNFTGQILWQFPVEFTNARKINKLIEVGFLPNVNDPSYSSDNTLIFKIDSITNLTTKTLYYNIQYKEIQIP